MQYNGSLRIDTATHHHSGHYYCLLLNRGRNTLQPQLLQPKRDDHNRAVQLHMVKRDSSDNNHVVELQLTEDDQHDCMIQSFLLQIQSSSDQNNWAVRPRRSVQGHGYDEEGVSAGISDSQFAAAVAASVVVTFLVGFSTGALSRAPLGRWVYQPSFNLYVSTGQKVQFLTCRHIISLQVRRYNSQIKPLDNCS